MKSGRSVAANIRSVPNGTVAPAMRIVCPRCRRRRRTSAFRSTRDSWAGTSSVRRRGSRRAQSTTALLYSPPLRRSGAPTSSTGARSRLASRTATTAARRRRAGRPAGAGRRWRRTRARAPGTPRGRHLRRRPCRASAIVASALRAGSAVATSGVAAATRTIPWWWMLMKAGALTRRPFSSRSSCRFSFSDTAVATVAPSSTKSALQLVRWGALGGDPRRLRAPSLRSSSRSCLLGECCDTVNGRRGGDKKVVKLARTEERRGGAREAEGQCECGGRAQALRRGPRHHRAQAPVASGARCCRSNSCPRKLPGS